MATRQSYESQNAEPPNPHPPRHSREYSSVSYSDQYAYSNPILHTDPSGNDPYWAEPAQRPVGYQETIEEGFDRERRECLYDEVLNGAHASATRCRPGYQLPVQDIGFILGINLSLAGGGGYGVGVEIVYDLYDFEADFFVYHGPTGGFGANASAYEGVVTGWSYYSNTSGVDNYRGPFGSVGAGWGPVSGQAFFSKLVDPNNPESGRMCGFALGVGFSWGIKGVDGSVGGSVSNYYSLSQIAALFGFDDQFSKKTFHRGGFHNQDIYDAVDFVNYIQESTSMVGGLTLVAPLIPIVFNNASANYVK